MKYTLTDPNGNVLLAVESSPVVIEADMKVDLDKAAKACESAFDEVTKYQDAMAVMSSEGFGEQVKIVASKVWEKIKEFFKWLKEWCKKIFEFITNKVVKISNKLKIKLLSKSEVKEIEVMTMDELKKIVKTGESFDPDARIDYSAVINRCKIIMQQIQSVVYLLSIEPIVDQNKFKENVKTTIEYINAGKTESSIEKLTEKYIKLEEVLKSLNLTKYSDEVAENVKKDIDNELGFDPNVRITEATKDASNVVDGLSKMTDKWWEEILKNYNISKNILTSGINEMMTASTDLEKYAETMLQLAQNASNSELNLARKKMEYANLCNRLVKNYIDQINYMISIADKAAIANENFIAVKNMILSARSKKDERHYREAKLRDGPRIM